MATAQQIKALLRSYGDADGEQFVSIALQIAAHEARAGKSKLAAELKKLVDEIRGQQTKGRVRGVVALATPSGELANLLSASYPATKLSQMVLSEAQDGQLRTVVREFRQREKLREHNLFPHRKLLLVGPPGVGKTMSSKALAGELKLPHFSIQLHSLITKFMGETAAKLHAVFEAMRETTGVYLFDEFDAIGATRGGANDVGEIRRVLNSFLQFLEQDQSDSIVIAATNLVGILDAALFRRFDDVVSYTRPTRSEIARLIANQLAAFQASQCLIDAASQAADGLSHADVAAACDQAAKEAVLGNRRTITERDLLNSIQKRLSRLELQQQRSFDRDG